MLTVYQESGGPKRPPALSIRRPYMNSTPTNQEGRFLTVLEDEKEGVDSPAAVADEDQQTVGLIFFEELN